MNFVLALHSHLPYVLNHGRWPHGSDWICEAAIDTYLPLLGQLERLEQERVPTPLTIGITPILANQLASPVFRDEQEAYFAQRLATCAEAAESLATTGDRHLLPLAGYWERHLLELREHFRRLDGNLAAAFRRHEEQGRIELISCAATHGFLPLLSRDESIRLQLGLGRAEHRRIFGRDPDGLWLPECAYRPRGSWEPLPGGPRIADRAGLEEFVARAGFRYFFVDSHLAAAGHAFRLYGAAGGPVEEGGVANSPYRAYRVAGASGPSPVSALARDPVSSRQVWSRQEGYPGDEWYLEFHKIRWPGGLKYWRVSAPGSDLGAKQPYDPPRARERAAEHARHFVRLLGQIAAQEGGKGGRGGKGGVETPASSAAPAPATGSSVIAVPFDTELFGHWWYEGVDFLGQVYRELGHQSAVQPVTARDHLRRTPADRAVHLTTGSWGANGDFGMWLNPGTDWTWPRLWAIEATFWEAAPSALRSPAHQLVLAQAAREMLLAMASDWQFIISTGAVTDYAVKRFTEHCADAEFLISALTPEANHLAAAQNRAAELWERDHVFPDIVTTLAAVLGK
jgi:1,4-alpha-glucan branching enzyme